MLFLPIPSNHRVWSRFNFQLRLAHFLIQAQIPLAYFYILAPILLLAVYVYLHLYLQRLWEEFSKLPAVFEDGTPLDRKSSPWIVNNAVRPYLLDADDARPRLARLESALITILVWYLMPLTLIILWFRYLFRHDWLWSIYQVVLLSVSLVVAIYFQQTAKETLSRKLNQRGRRKDLFQYVLALLLFVVFFALASDKAIKATYFSLANANLSESNLRGIDLNGRNLSGADLTRTDLTDANLGSVDLTRAILTETTLTRSTLTDASLTDAVLPDANLDFAELYRADLTRANLPRANLTGANLLGAFSERRLSERRLSERRQPERRCPDRRRPARRQPDRRRPVHRRPAAAPS